MTRVALLLLLASLAFGQTNPWKRQGTTISPRRSGDSVSIDTTLPALAPAGSQGLKGDLNVGPVPGGSAVTAYGDSFTCCLNGGGYGASAPEKSYAAMLAAAKGWTLTNAGDAGKQLVDTAIVALIWPKTVAVGERYTMLLGYNDMRAWGTTAAAQTQYKDALTALAARLAIPATSVTKIGTLGAGAKTGTWGGTPVYSGVGLTSNVAGSTLTFTATGSTIYLAGIQINNGGTATVTIDGSAAGMINYGGWSVNGGNGAIFGPFVYRWTGLSNTAHTLVLTVAEAKQVYVEWVAGLSGSHPTWPRVYVGNVPKMNATGYTLGAPFNAGSDAAVGQFNTKIAEAIQTLAADGLNVFPVDVSPAYTVATDVAADNIHPNDTGHAHIRDAFLDAINGDTAGAVDSTNGYVGAQQAFRAGSAVGITRTVKHLCADGTTVGVMTITGGIITATTCP